MEKHNIYQWDEIYPTVEDFEDDIKKGNLYVAEENEKIIALYVISDEADEAYNYAKWKYPNETSLVLHRFCVSPGFQNRGIGKKVLMKLNHKLRTGVMNQSVWMSLRKIRMHKDCIVIMGMKSVNLLNGEKDVLI